MALENNFKPLAVRALGMKDDEIDTLIEESVFCDANKQDKYKLFELCRRDPDMYSVSVSQNSKINARLKAEYEEYIRQCNKSVVDAQYISLRQLQCIEDCNYEELLFGRDKDSLFANLMEGGYYDKLVSMRNKSLKFLCGVIGGETHREEG